MTRALQSCEGMPFYSGAFGVEKTLHDLAKTINNVMIPLYAALLGQAVVLQPKPEPLRGFKLYLGNRLKPYCLEIKAKTGIECACKYLLSRSLIEQV
jgi:hypothetical protein